MSITYELIEPLVVQRSIEGSRMVCTFKAPNGNIIESQATIRRERDIQSQITNRVTRVAATQTRMAITRTLSQALGGGLLGRTASMVVRTASTPQALGIQFSESEKRNAVIEAFEKVQNHFQLDSSNGSWKSPIVSQHSTNEQLSLFEKQLKDYPLSNRFDKEVLARMMVEVASADGRMDDAEKDFIDSFLSKEIGTVDSLIHRDPLSDMECEETSVTAKKTIYMLAWVVALVDYDISTEEKEKLYSFAKKLGLNDVETREMIKTSKYYILENAFSEEINRSELEDLAKCLQISNDEAERCLIQYKKRM